jgi:urease subunit beta
MIPGEYILEKEPIIANAGRKTVKLTVKNTGDRAIQIGSHFHFFEINRAMKFTREEALGMRLNIPSGTAVRFEPGQTQDVELVALGGASTVYGFNSLCEGDLTKQEVREQSLRNVKEFCDGKR